MDWKAVRSEWENSDITFKDLAAKHDVKDATIRSRKNREKWQRNDATQHTKQRGNVATQKRRRGAPKGSSNAKGNRGNREPKNTFSERNLNALKHGLFSRYMPKETLEIMGMVAGSDPVDLLWMQIELQFAAIIRAQQIMFVDDKDDMTREIKKSAEADGLDSTEWDIQYAWDKHATFMNAQSKAMSELRGLIKQFDEMAHIDDERRLKLQSMQVGIDKAKAEIGRIEGESGNEDDAIDDWVEAVTADE